MSNIQNKYNEFEIVYKNNILVYLCKILKCIKLIFNILIIYLHHDANEAPRIFKKWKLAKLHNVKALVDFPKNVILNDWRREGTYYHYQWPSTCFKWSIMLLYTIDMNHKYLNIIFYIFGNPFDKLQLPHPSLL